MVDNRDFHRLNRYKWYASKMGQQFYAARHRPKGEKPNLVLMHREVLNAPSGVEVDHRFGNGLDNRRRKIRIATNSQNHMSVQKPQARKSSKYRGVCWNRFAGKWRAGLRMGGRHFHLGYFHNEKEAAIAYDRAAKKYFGKFAAPNFR